MNDQEPVPDHVVGDDRHSRRPAGHEDEDGPLSLYTADSPYCIVHPDDLLLLKAVLWPDVQFYDKQIEMFWSALTCKETYVKAGNMLGKDFALGFLALSVFLVCMSRKIKCRIVTTSVSDDHLRILWAEIGKFVATSREPLTLGSSRLGGSLVMLHREIRVAGETVKRGQPPDSYLIGRVCEKPEGFSGHHAPMAMLLYDELSGVGNEVRQQGRRWFTNSCGVGNPNPPCNTFFQELTEKHPPGHPLRDRAGFPVINTIQIKASDSPNVRARTRVLPGVLDWNEYKLRRDTWGEFDQCVSLDAEFWRGRGAFLFPPEWLNRAEQLDAERKALPRVHQFAEDGTRYPGGNRARRAKAVGIDPAEGGDSTAMVAVDELGVIELETRKTPNTDDAYTFAVAFMKRHGVKPERVCWDRGGGGQQHADRMRAAGYKVRSVGFGEAALPEIEEAARGRADAIDARERRYAFVNRRAQLYGELSQLLDPGSSDSGFSIPAECDILRRQLGPIPKRFDAEGRLKLPPKRRKPKRGAGGAGEDEKSLEEILGCSPDEADALCLAVHAMLHAPRVIKVGARAG